MTRTRSGFRLSGLAIILTAMLFALLSGPSAAAEPEASPAARPKVIVIDVHDTLQTERESVFVRQMNRAGRSHAAAILINLSSPGGLAGSTDEMVAAMRRSALPVIVWAGAPRTRVSGQALRLLAAADVAVLNPGSFLAPLWAEKPHLLSPAEQNAASQQLSAQLAKLAAEHGRAVDIVDDLSFGQHWFTPAEAVQAGFVDGVAERATDVLRISNGRVAQRPGGPVTLLVENARFETLGTEPQETLLLSLMNPDLAVLLLTLGLLLIYLEINTPGTVIPGAAGVLLVLLAAYALHLLPLGLLGLVLCVAAAVFLLLEARFSTGGGLAAIGVVLLVAGLRLLVRGPIPQLQVSWGTAVGAGIGFGGVTATLVVLGMEARRAKVKTGSEAMLGWLAVAQTPLAPEGQILVRGELWRARMTTRESFVAAGEKVKVLRADGLTLEVTAVPVSTSV